MNHSAESVLSDVCSIDNLYHKYAELVAYRRYMWSQLPHTMTNPYSFAVHPFESSPRSSGRNSRAEHKSDLQSPCNQRSCEGLHHSVVLDAGDNLGPREIHQSLINCDKSSAYGHLPILFPGPLPGGFDNVPHWS
jgi:hypothetical protein